MSTTLRVNQSTRDRVAAVAKATGRPMGEVIDLAVEAYERALFWQEFSDGWSKLADSSDWSEVEAERAAESPSLADGMR